MNANTIQQQLHVNTILHGDCIEMMREMPTNSVDFTLTDPTYLVNYRDRDGRTIQNDVKADWLKPAMAEAYCVLKQDRVVVMFYGWTKIDAWKDAGFQPVGHLVFRKTYSSKSRFRRYQHEQAFLLAKGRPPLPKQPLGDVMDMPYSGNKLHPRKNLSQRWLRWSAASHYRIDDESDNSGKCSEVADGVARESEGTGRLSFLCSVGQGVPQRRFGVRLLMLQSQRRRGGSRQPNVENIESCGVERWLDELAQELKSRIYQPLPARRVYIPKPTENSGL